MYVSHCNTFCYCFVYVFFEIWKWFTTIGTLIMTRHVEKIIMVKLGCEPQMKHC